MKSCCVVGGLGFVGSSTAIRLKELGYDVCVVDDISFGNRKNLDGYDIKIHQYDFNIIAADFWNRFDCVVTSHCSNIIYAQTHFAETIVNNAINTIHLFEKYNGKIINLSTASVYGNSDIIPTMEDSELKFSNAYDTSKRIAELFLQQRKNYTTLRLSNVFGIRQRPDNPYCGAMSKLISKALENQPMEIFGDGLQTRDFNYIDNVVSAIVMAVEQPAKNTEINIASQKEYSVIQIARIIAQHLDKLPNIKYIPKRSIDGIGRRCLNISKAKELLGWTPEIDLEEGISLTIQWMQDETKIS